MRVLILLLVSLLPIPGLAASNVIDDVDEHAFGWAEVVIDPRNAIEDEEEEEDDFYGGDDFISIATGTKKLIYKAPSVASVITATDIVKMGATNINEVLQRVAGLHVMPSNLSRLDTMYTIRGIGSGFNPQILVMLNGVEIKKSATSGLPSTFNLPVTNIARVEVIRGPGSAVYGADAFSGVINIITKSVAANNDIELGGRVGSWDSNEYWLNANYQSGDFSSRLAMDKMQSDGDRQRIAQTDLQSTFDMLTGTEASLAPTHLASHYDITNIQLDLNYGNWHFENWWWQQDQAGQGAGGAQAIDHTGRHDYDSYRGVISYEHKYSDVTEFNLQAYYQRAVETSVLVLFPSGTLLPIDEFGLIGQFLSGLDEVLFTDGFIGVPQFDQTDTAINATLTNHALTDHIFRVNFGFVHKDLDTSEWKNFGAGVLDSTHWNHGVPPPVVNGELTNVSNTENVFINDTYREQHFFSLQDEWQLSNDIEVVGGVRYDKYSDFGSTINPRLAVVWESNDKLTTKFLYGSAFRPPAFDELYNANNPALLGDENLKPERIDTVELAFNYRPSFDDRIVVSFFSYKASDLIVLVEDGNNQNAKRKANASLQTGYGFEIETQWALSERLDLYANYSFQRSEAQGVGDSAGIAQLSDQYRVPDVPGYTAMVALDLKFNDEYSGYIQSYYVADRKRLSHDPRNDVADYLLLDLSLRYQPLGADHSISMSVKNLQNKEVFEPSDGSIYNDLVMPHRQLWLQLEYVF